MVGNRLTIADLSLAGYVFMPEETGIDHSAYPAIAAWKDRISSMPGWRHPYDQCRVPPRFKQFEQASSSVRMDAPPL
ncbi:glutathione S-transferase [Rhizobium sp. BK049]|nr:glutathione S-transferase [Rhizobium sp. BK049]